MSPDNVIALVRLFFIQSVSLY